MKNFKHTIGFLFVAIFLLTSCRQNQVYNFGTVLTPSNIKVSTSIMGATDTNPYGDGSGQVTFTATSKDAITYKYIFEGDESMAPSGSKTFSFGTTGVHTYTVTVVAIGMGGTSASETVDVEVLASYAPPADLLKMLTNNSTRTWRIKAESPGHFGLGPVGGTIPGEWFSAAANDKAGLGMYDDKYVFDNSGTFSHTTNGDVYGKAVPMAQDLGGDQGLTPNGNDEFENYPLADYSTSWALSAPGGQETLSLTGVGFLGFYVGGSHQYKIMSRSENEMLLKTTDWNSGFDWWFILVAE